MQEASLRAFRAIGGFAGGNARAWVLTIVRHTAFSWLAQESPRDAGRGRRSRGGRARAGTAGQRPAHANAATPETALIAKADAARLEAAIAALPLPFRETLVLRDIQGLDYREIAQVTEVPVGTVMSRLARARRRLIETIGTDEP